MPTIAELAQPMLRLAGVRINPRTNGPHRTTNGPTTKYRNLILKTVADGVERKVTLPPSPAISWIGYSADGRRFAFTQTRDNGIELWVGGDRHRPGQGRDAGAVELRARHRRRARGSATARRCSAHSPWPTAARRRSKSEVPTGPNIQENRGRSAANATFEDMLTSAHDEALFEYYATGQLAIVDAASGQRTPIGRPGHLRGLPHVTRWALRAGRAHQAAVLVARAATTTSRRRSRSGIASGAIVKTIADLPRRPTPCRPAACCPGRARGAGTPSQPATVAWVEALDGGDPKSKVTPRDKIVTLAAPFTAAPTEIARTEWRVQNVTWTSAGVGWINESDRATRMIRTSVIDTPGAAPRKLFERSSEDSYANPGHSRCARCARRARKRRSRSATPCT